jgi:hypothetical protein
MRPRRCFSVLMPQPSVKLVGGHLDQVLGPPTGPDACRNTAKLVFKCAPLSVQHPQRLPKLRMTGMVLEPFWEPDQPSELHVSERLRPSVVGPSVNTASWWSRRAAGPRRHDFPARSGRCRQAHKPARVRKAHGRPAEGSGSMFSIHGRFVAERQGPARRSAPQLGC